jgi:two-component system sensor histidine kinase YesM
MKINRFYYTSIKVKLISAYILLAIIPIFIITIFSNIVYTKNMQTQIDTLLEYGMNQAEKTVGDNLKDYENFLYNIVLDKEILYYSQKIQENNDAPFNKHFMIQKLIAYTNVEQEVRSVVFVSNSLDYASYEKNSFITHESYFYDEKIRKELLEECSGEDGVTLISTRNLRTVRNRDEYMFFLAAPVKDYVARKQHGVLFIGINESTLADLTSQNKNYRKDGSEILSSNNIIVDKDNYIVSYEDKSYIGKSISTFTDKNIHGNLFIKEKEIAGTPWRLVNIIDRDYMLKDVRGYGILVIAISIIITSAFFILIITITNRYSNSISEISQGIRSFGKGQFDVKIDFEEKDELFVIAKQFNKMTTRINNLVNTLEKQKKDTEIAVNLKRESELRALESQINPHFIYNTLDTINWIAIDNNEDEISEMLSTLGDLLRYSISNIDIIVTLDAEIQWIKKYMYLQKIRFNNSFECIYDISNEALKYPVHKLLLQPAIENAIIHGFEGIKSGGIIKISAFVDEANILCVKISDNGHGIDEDVLNHIKEYINDDNLFDGNNIGVKNIVNRVKLYYLGQAEIKIESKKGYGTCIQLMLPYKKINKEGETYENFGC